MHPHEECANLVSCSVNSVSSSSMSSITSMVATELVLTNNNKPPRSPNSDAEKISPLVAVPIQNHPSPLRARAQSTDSGTSSFLRNKKSTAATTTANSNSLPPLRNRRFFSTDTTTTSTSTSSSSSYSNSPPPLAPGRRRSYSSDSDDQSSSRSTVTSVSSTKSQQQRRRQRHGGRREQLGRRASCSSIMSSSSSNNSSHQKSTTTTAAAPGAGLVALDLQTLETELQKNALLHGKRDVSVGKLWNAIGNLHFRNGNHRAAIQAYKQAAATVVGTRSSCDPGPLHVSATANLNLGTVYWNLLKVDKSIQYLLQALAAFEKELTASAAAASGKKAAQSEGDAAVACSLDVASCHHQLGLAYSLQHRFDEAVISMETACRMRATLLGTNDPKTARTLDALGRIHLVRGDYNQALACHEQALHALRLAQFPVTSTLENIAAVHMRRGDFSAAIHVHVQVVYMHKSAWQKVSSNNLQQQSTSSCSIGFGLAEQYYESLQQLAMAYDHVGETKYADHCRQEAAEVLEQDL